MKKTYFYYCLALAVLVTGLYQIFMPGSAYVVEQHIKPGQIAERDIIAPLDFQIRKSARSLKDEQDAVTALIQPVYMFADEVQFERVKAVNQLFDKLNASSSIADTTNVKQVFEAAGIPLEHRSQLFLTVAANRKQLYQYLLNALDEAYTTGIYANLDVDSIYISTGEGTRLVRREKLKSLEEARSGILDAAPGSAFRNCLEDILAEVLIPNVVRDKAKYDELVQAALAAIPQTTGKVTKNEIIVRRNSRISEEDVNKIQSLVFAQQQGNVKINTWKSLSVSISFFLYFFTLGLLLYSFCFLFYPQLLVHKYHFAPIIGGLAFNAVLAIINNQLLGLQTLLIPYSLTIITAAIILDTPFAIFYNFLSFAGIYPFVNWETFSPLVLVLATLGVLLLMSRLNDKHQYLSIWLYLVVTTLGLTLIFALYKTETLPVIAGNLGYAFVSSTLSVILMLFVVPYIEKKWNLATKQRLLELLDFNHPLLKRLATEAVGTYHHSLIVGNLAERAAEAIGANPLLARVGSYYHDIGKVGSPRIFTENNSESSTIHDALQPSDSARRIKNHVTEGILLARKCRIPQSVIDIIEQHHGTGYIRYFLDKAEKSRISIDLNAFRYGGPKPASKEAALVMIADIVESTTKSWSEISEADIRKILDDTVYRLIKEKQFDDSPLTLKDLVMAKECMVPVLESIYRKRLQYPEMKDRDEN